MESTSVSMSEQEYFEQRLDDQIEWYSQESGFNKQWYRVVQMVQIFCSALIPLFVGYVSPDTASLKILVGLLGVIVAVAGGFSTLFKFQENWIQYRATSESLKHQKFLFVTGTDPYDKENSFALLVQQVEALISAEQSAWLQHAKAKQQPGPKS